jgi:site-specific DNA-methyltransferase (adenine-specific)/modification methylase
MTIASTESPARVPGTPHELVVLSDSVSIYRGDCRDILPTLGEVDAVVTDPPYGLGKRMSGGTWGKADKYGDMWEWDKEAPHEAVAAVLGLARPTIMWGGNYFAVPPSRCWLSWSKVNVVQTMASMELAWTNFDRPAKEWRGPVGVHDTGHHTQKPVPLMAWCLSFLPEACAVCDPFMGSGSTGIACIRTGRKFIGIEKDARYFEIARARLENELRQGLLPLKHNARLDRPEGAKEQP